MARVFLLGMPGSGKSTLGGKVASKLKMTFFDLDTLIEGYEKCSIAEIFDRHGEQRFRETERMLLHSAIEGNENFILATGGGTPCFYDNLKRMQSAGATVFIDPSLEIIIDRLSKSNIGDRPKLRELDLVATLQETYTIRLPFYQQATHRLSSNEANEESLINLLKTII